MALKAQLERSLGGRVAGPGGGEFLGTKFKSMQIHRH